LRSPAITRQCDVELSPAASFVRVSGSTSARSRANWTVRPATVAETFNRSRSQAPVDPCSQATAPRRSRTSSWASRPAFNRLIARENRSMFAFSASSGSARTSTRNVSSTADSKLPMDVTLNAGPTVSVAQKQKLNLWTEMTRHETVENDDVKSTRPSG
jgi:hypothetical protein